MRPAGISLASLPSGRQRLRIERRALLRAWLRARPSEAVTAIDVNVGDAFTASFLRTGTRVPLPRARALGGICLRGDAIGRRTRARSVGGGGRTAVGLTGRSTVGATGIAWRRGIGRRRAIGWRSGIGRRRRRAVLGVCRLHPSRRCQNAHAGDRDQSVLHDWPPLGLTRVEQDNGRVRRMFRLWRQRKQFKENDSKRRACSARQRAAAFHSLTKTPPGCVAGREVASRAGSREPLWAGFMRGGSAQANTARGQLFLTSFLRRPRRNAAHDPRRAQLYAAALNDRRQNAGPAPAQRLQSLKLPARSGF